VQPKEFVRPAVDTSPLDRPSDRTGAFCDCEILLNVYQNSRMARGLRQTLSEEMERQEE
jgi:hypothetical protein